MVAGVTTIGSYCTMNTFVDLIGYEADNIAKVVNTVTFGTGSAITTSVITADMQKNGNKRSRNVSTRQKSTIGSSNNNYVKVTNGKLMR